MNDDVKAAVERFHTWEFDGLDARDHAALLAHIDGEPARIAAACEETREACARRVPSIGQPHDCFEAVRTTPLTATPLGDALRLSNETVVKLAQAFASAVDGMSDAGKAATEAQARADEGVRYWTDLAQAEARDAAALRARVAELEAEVEAQRASSQRHMNGRESYWVEQRTKWIAECDRIGESCKWHAARAEKAEAERDVLRAQVEAARKVCELRIKTQWRVPDVYITAHDVLRAMDGAKP